METAFTPLAGLAGGALIGLASALLVLGNGRIAGISGILGGSLAGGRAELAWRLPFLVALPLGAWLVRQLAGDPLGFAIAPQPILLIAGGLLVGYGTQLGGGCTSGHGVCGLSRGSLRSLAATMAFMTTGAATVAIVRHALGGAP